MLLAEQTFLELSDLKKSAKSTKQRAIRRLKKIMENIHGDQWTKDF